MTKLQGKLQHSHDMAQHRKNVTEQEIENKMKRITVEILAGITLIVILSGVLACVSN